MTIPPPDVCQRLIELHARLGLSDGALDQLLELLAAHGLGWNDWPEFFALAVTPSSMQHQARRRFVGLHALVGTATTKAQRAQARNALIKLCAEQSLSWASDLPSILAADWLEKNPLSKPSATVSPAPNDLEVNLFELNRIVLEDRVVLTSAELIVCTLWGLNSYVYDAFEYAPQLGIVAPGSGFGKSTLRKTLAAIVHEAWYSHHATAAAISRKLRRQPRTTVLLDEAENQNLLGDRKLRAVLDAAYELDGSTDLVEGGETIKVPVFAPVAWAIRGEIHDVPLSVQSRAFVIQPKRATPAVRRQRNDPELLEVRQQNSKWAASCKLDRDPPIPAKLEHDPRVADNCRPLLSIADNLGRGEEAREALIKLCAGRSHPDVAVMALLDSHKVFAMLGIDRIAKNRKDARDGALADKVIEGGDTFWGSWRGVNDRGQPHELTPNELSRLLRRFGVFARTTWPTPRLDNSKSFAGYYFSDIEKAVRDYWPDETYTPTQPAKIIRLAKP